MQAQISMRYGRLTGLSIYHYTITGGLKSKLKKKLLKQILTRKHVIAASKTGIRSLLPITDYRLQLVERTTVEFPHENTQQLSKWLKILIEIALGSSGSNEKGQLTVLVDATKTQLTEARIFVKITNQTFASGQFFIKFRPFSKYRFIGFQSYDYCAKVYKIFQEIGVLHSCEWLNSNTGLVGGSSTSELAIILEDQKIDLDRAHYGLPVRTEIQAALRADDEFTDYIQPELTDIGAFDYCTTVSKMLNTMSIKLHEKLLFEHESIDVSVIGNLLIGHQKVVSQLKAAYYNGFYQGAAGKTLAIMTFGNGIKLQSNQVCDLINKYSSGEADGDVILIQGAISWSKSHENYSLLMNEGSDIKMADGIYVLAPRRIGLREYEFLNVLGPRYFLHVGEASSIVLGDFVYKGFRKLHLQTHVLQNMRVKEGCYFVGIDLGHHAEEEFSNTVFTWFDNRGVYLFRRVVEGTLNEALDSVVVQSQLRSAQASFESLGLPMPKHIIYHRDGKVHLYDCQRLSDWTWLLLGTEKVDVVEVSKSGQPMISVGTINSLSQPKSGLACIFKSLKFGLLVTSGTQNSNGGARIVNPLVIRHAFGRTDFNDLVYQVYWLSHMYSNTMYRVPRLPITTRLADSLAGTRQQKKTFV